MTELITFVKKPHREILKHLQMAALTACAQASHRHLLLIGVKRVTDTWRGRPPLLLLLLSLCALTCPHVACYVPLCSSNNMLFLSSTSVSCVAFCVVILMMVVVFYRKDPLCCRFRPYTTENYTVSTTFFWKVPDISRTHSDPLMLSTVHFTTTTYYYLV